MSEIVRPLAAEGQHGGAQEPTPQGPGTAQRLTLIPADRIAWMLATASRAPSIHNTQPWKFRLGPHAIELYADSRRRLRRDRAGREMLMSCGAVLFGL